MRRTQSFTVLHQSVTNLPVSRLGAYLHVGGEIFQNGFSNRIP
jgi:hypothetical protein